MSKRAFLAGLLLIISITVPAFSAIEAGQSVIVKIMGVPVDQKAMIDETYPISERGMINLPFVNEIPAAGLEAGQLSKKIQQAYQDGGIFKNPVIQVIANQIDAAPVEEVVHLGGHVRAPGPRPYQRGLTVFQAVQAAGGETEFGAINRVMVLRDGKTFEINLKTPKGKMVVAEPKDTIEVPQKNWRGG